jgi:PHD/YefM family antitoxin component YafN of YafNO toxin-antitoxin module
MPKDGNGNHMPDGTLDITEAREQFNRLDQRLEDERVIYVTRHNKKVFAVVDIEYLQTVLETIEIMADPESYKLFQQGLADLRDGRVHDHDDVKKELGL